MFSGALNKSVFHGHTLLLEISEENDKHKFVYIGGDMVCSFVTSDNIYEYILNTDIIFILIMLLRDRKRLFVGSEFQNY